MNTTLTSWIFPKRFIDASGDPDPYLEAMSESAGATIQ
jgi:hypothetical protein